MKYKIIDGVIFLVFLSLIVGFTIYSDLPSQSKIFSSTDEVGDDFGAGKIRYPNDKESYQQGMLDIKSFRVENDNGSYVFKYEMAHKITKKTIEKLMIETYINIPGQNGLIEPKKYGAAIQFDKTKPAKYHIRIIPNRSTIDFLNEANQQNIHSNVEYEGCLITVSYSKALFDTDNLRSAMFYVFSAGYDRLGADNYLKVLENGEKWYFSGGSNGFTDSNVIDCVHPMQKAILANHGNQQYAVLRPIGNRILFQYSIKEFFLFAEVIFALVYYVLLAIRKENI